MESSRKQQGATVMIRNPLFLLVGLERLELSTN